MINKIKELLGIDFEDKSKDGKIQFCIDLVTDMVLNYCNIDSIPERLNNVITALCTDAYRKAAYGNESLTGDEKSIRRGDTTIEYVTAADITAAVSGSDFLAQYKTQLNRFRKVKFP